MDNKIIVDNLNLDEKWVLQCYLQDIESLLESLQIQRENVGQPSKMTYEQLEEVCRRMFKDLK